MSDARAPGDLSVFSTADNLPFVDIRGAGRLAVDLTLRVTDVVETMHDNIARLPPMFGRARVRPATGLTAFVYRRVRGVTRLVGGTLDAILAPLATLMPVTAEWPRRDAVVGAINGVLGDHLEATDNPLQIPMQLRRRRPAVDPHGEPSRVIATRPRVVVMVHGLCTTDAVWQRGSHDHGVRLADDLDAELVYLRYNSGRHVSTNGAQFAHLLEAMLGAWTQPLREIVLVGHSMGGLVIRSACAAGHAAGHAWPQRLRALIFLGTPHHGAPLERHGHGVDRLLAASPYTVAFAHVARLRSAGITDLRHGSVLDSDWTGRDRFARGGYRCRPQPLPRHVPAFTIAGSLGKTPGSRGRSPRGDGLVPVASALGQPADPALAIGFAPSSRFVAYGTGHLDLLESESVYARMQRWLAAGRARR